MVYAVSLAIYKVNNIEVLYANICPRIEEKKREPIHLKIFVMVRGTRDLISEELAFTSHLLYEFQELLSLFALSRRNNTTNHSHVPNLLRQQNEIT